jgi:hypothetical protein
VTPFQYAWTADTADPQVQRSWSEADFVRLMRTGLRPDGTEVSPVMPWQSVAAMSDEDVHALWLYFRSLPSMPTGD